MNANTKPTRIRPVPVRIPPELVERIDAARGLVPRETYVRHLIAVALDQVEASSSPAERDR